MLMAGSTMRLFANIVFAMLAIGVYVWIAAGSPIIGGIAVLCLVHSLVLAVRLIDLPGPVLSAGRNGLVFSNRITSQDLLAWDEIKTLKVFTLHYQFLSVPWMSYLMIRTNKRSYFDGTSRLLPTTWFGIYFLPTRVLHGGVRSVRQLMTILDRLREADRHDAASRPDDSPIPEASLRWNMLRNVTFPLPRDGVPDEAVVATARDSAMEMAGLHRDLVPEPVRQQILASESAKALATKGEEWGRQFVQESKGQTSVPQTPAPKQALPADFGRKGVMLNGKPLK